MEGLLLRMLLTGAVSGAAIGYAAVMLLPGKQRISKWETMAIGVGAAWLGGFLAGLFGFGEGRGIHWGVLAFQVALAALGVWLWLDFRNRRVKKMLVPDVPAVGKKNGNGDGKSNEKGADAEDKENGKRKDKDNDKEKDKGIKPDLPGPL